MDDPANPRVCPVRVEDGISAEVVGRDFTLHDGRTGKVHFLNASAALIWDLADGTRDARALALELAQRFDRPASETLAEVERILGEFAGEGLIEFRGS